MHIWRFLQAAAAAAVLTGLAAAPSTGQQRAAPWVRHTIDAGSRGADGVKLADLNGDGRPDVVTGWEEGGVARIAFHPGPAAVRSAWRSVTAGPAPSVEDTAPADLDGDGGFDLISACEGAVRTLFFHWGPRDRSRAGDDGAWLTQALPGSVGLMRWMYTLPAQIDGRYGVDFYAGGRDAGAVVGWWESPPRPRDLDGWQWRKLAPAGWLMDLAERDMDGDGDGDLVYTDRKPPDSGCFWLENPGAAAVAGAWIRHRIGAAGENAMFMAPADLDGDGLDDLAVAIQPRRILLLRRLDGSGLNWAPRYLSLPEAAGNSKGIAAGDFNGDGHIDLAFTCEAATNGRSGVMWLQAPADPFSGEWTPHDVSGADGVKYDAIAAVDLDGDGDLDLVTCEETRGLGVIWYENPLRGGRGE